MRTAWLIFHSDHPFLHAERDACLMRPPLTVQFAEALPLFVLFFPFKMKTRVSVESYFRDIILEIGFFLWSSNPHCHLPRDNVVEYKREAGVIGS